MQCIHMGTGWDRLLQQNS